jgi:hypothetical protein
MDKDAEVVHDGTPNMEEYMLAVLKEDYAAISKEIAAENEEHSVALQELHKEAARIYAERRKLCHKINGQCKWKPMGNHAYPDYQCEYCGIIKS